VTDSIQHLIEPHIQDLGGFQVRRLLPSDVLKLVGPFIFFDHLGPAVFAPGQGVDVQGATSAPEPLRAFVFARSQRSKKFVLIDKKTSVREKVPSCDKKGGSR